MKNSNHLKCSVEINIEELYIVYTALALKNPPQPLKKILQKGLKDLRGRLKPIFDCYQLDGSKGDEIYRQLLEKYNEKTSLKRVEKDLAHEYE